ncbi:MAG: hypothetical protein RIS09_787, partial [Actinomycetota bacterium]
VPHTAENPIAVAFQHVHNQIPAPSEFRKGIPASIDALVQKATSRNPQDRFQSAAEFLEAVKSVRMLIESGDFDSMPRNIQSDDTAIITKPEQSNAEDSSMKKPKRKRRGFLILLSLIVPLSALGYFSFQTLNNVTVPQLVGMTENQARLELQNRELEAVVVEEYSDTVAEDVVLRATPESGSSVARSSEVEIVISLGPELFEIPDVIGLDWQDASPLLQDAGFEAEIVDEIFHPEFPAGSIVEIDPPAFSKHRKETSIAVVLSKGPAPIALPNVINLSESQATSALQAKGFTQIIIKREFSGSVKKGNVISMTPKAKSKHFTSITVELTLSDGPPPVKVPNITGMTLKRAIETLEKAGLSYKIRTENKCKKPKSRIVQQQFSAANSLVPRGSVIELGIYNNC